MRRAEAAIEPPAATGDLSCLDGLMDLPLDWFAPAGGLESLFSGSMDSVIGSGADSRKICSFAERKWREVTRPVTSPLEILRRGLPPDLSNAFEFANRLGQLGSRTAGGSGQTADPFIPLPRQNPRPAGTPANASQGQPGSKGEKSGNPVEEIWKSLYGSGEPQ